MSRDKAALHQPRATPDRLKWPVSFVSRWRTQAHAELAGLLAGKSKKRL